MGTQLRHPLSSVESGAECTHWWRYFIQLCTEVWSVPVHHSKCCYLADKWENIGKGPRHSKGFNGDSPEWNHSTLESTPARHHEERKMPRMLPSLKVEKYVSLFRHSQTSSWITTDCCNPHAIILLISCLIQVIVLIYTVIHPEFSEKGQL